MPAKIPDGKRAAILEDIRAKGGSTRAIGTGHGVSDAAVRKIAKDEGEADAFPREHTEKATRARVADMAEQRVRIAEKYLSKAEQLLDQMDEPHLVHNFGGKENTYAEHLLDRAPTGDLRNLMTTSAVAVDKHMKLIASDTESGAATAALMLSGNTSMRSRQATSPDYRDRLRAQQQPQSWDLVHHVSDASADE